MTHGSPPPPHTDTIYQLAEHLRDLDGAPHPPLSAEVQAALDEAENLAMVEEFFDLTDEQIRRTAELEQFFRQEIDRRRDARPDVRKEGRRPLPPLVPAAPTMTVDLLPEPLRPYIVDSAERLSVHVEMVAVPLIVALGSVIGRQVGIHPKAKDTGWIETGNLWGVIIAPPSSRKSPAIAEGTRHLAALQAEELRVNATEELSRGVQRDIIDAHIGKLKRQATSKNGDPEDMAEALLEKRQDLAKLEVPEPRLIVNDTTVEKLGELLADNPNGLLYLRDELMGLLKSTEKSGHENDRPFLLEAWNGTGSYTFDRIGRGTKHIPAVNLSIFGGTQPGKMRVYIESAIKGDSGADGLLQRFQLMVWPERAPLNRRVDRFPDAAASRRVENIFRRLRHIDPGEFAATPSHADKPPALHFSREAQERFDAWLTEGDAKLETPEVMAAPAFQAHLVKYQSLVPRLALVFHLVDGADGAPAGPISLQAVERAIAWTAFLEAHARKVYAAELNRDLQRAHAIVELIEHGEITTSTTVRDIYTKWPRLGSASDIRRAITILEDHQWLELIEKPNPGARPSEVLVLTSTLLS